MAKTDKIPPFDPEVWTNWEARFLEEEEQAYREQSPEVPTEIIPQHDLMSPREVCIELRWSLSTLRRNTKSRKLAYIKEAGKVKFKRADVERYKAKRYVSEK
jgi:excisionase family DNA binding protein